MEFAVLKRLFYSVLLLSFVLLLVVSVGLAQETPDDNGGLDPVDTGTSEIPTREPQPAPTTRLRADNAILDVFFATLPQGGVGLVQVQEIDSALPGKRITSARARFITQAIEFYVVDGRFNGLLSVDMEQTPRRYDLDVYVAYEDQTETTINAQVEVVGGGFVRQQVEIPPERMFLLEPEVERSELARLEGLISRFTPTHYWTSEGFQMPILARLTSPFGAFRTFNSAYNTRHTGWDIRSTTGMPIMASAPGRVVFANRLEVRGDYLLIDHGWGVFSGYAHLAQTHVTNGQDIAKGQIVGTVGESGRTSGPHFHWEMAVNGEWVDTVRMITMWMP